MTRINYVDGNEPRLFSQMQLYVRFFGDRDVQVEAISGECDDTAAHRSWDAHLQRNDSFVVDTMHGQYKSVR